MQNMDAIQVLKRDHRAVEALFASFEKLGDRATKEKKAITAKITRELSLHAAVEEELSYPAVRARVKDKDDLVLELLEEHHLMKVLLSELQSLSPTSERYAAKMTVLKEMMKHHVAEQENDLFPALQKKLSKKTLVELGEALVSAKRIAPTRPHPNAPDEPPGNLIAGLPAAIIDRIRDLVAVRMTAASVKRATSATVTRLTPGADRNPRKTFAAAASMHRIGRAAKPVKKTAKKATKRKAR
jgi:hemerythrin superfamily protein